MYQQADDGGFGEKGLRIMNNEQGIMNNEQGTGLPAGRQGMLNVEL